jgi:hypothetical protein
MFSDVAPHLVADQREDTINGLAATGQRDIPNVRTPRWNWR